MKFYIKFIVFCVLLSSTTLVARDVNYFRLRGEQMYLEGRYQDALDQFAKFEMRAGDSYAYDEEYLHCKAEVNYKLARFDDALEAYLPLLETSPDDVNYAFLQGLISRSSQPGKYAYLLSDNMGGGSEASAETDAFAYFSVEPFHAINTHYSEFAAVDFNGRVYFTSTRKRRLDKEVDLDVERYNIFSCDYNEAHNLYSSNGVNYIHLSEAQKADLDSARSKFKVKSESAFNKSYHNGPITFYDDHMAYVTINRDIKKREENVSSLTLQSVILDGAPSSYNNTGADYFRSFFGEANVGQITFSPDKTMACMAVKFPDSESESDLWYAVKNTDGNWREPFRAGDDLNTGYNDMFPYWAEDDYLYFSSDGYDGAGGLDVFRVDMTKSYTIPENLGPGVNTPYDDFAFSVDSAGNGYLSSGRLGGRGNDDIYTVSLKRGRVKVVLVGDTSWVDNPDFTLCDKRFDDDLELINVKDSSVYISQELNYGEYNLKHSFPVDSLHTPIQLYEDTAVVYVHFAKIDPDTIPVNFTNFCFDCDGMDDISMDKFGRLVEFLSSFPEIELKLIGHTDNFGSSEYNDALAMRRATAMEQWLRDAGLENPVKKIARGERDCVSTTDHSLNRRVDVELYWPGDDEKITFVSDEDERLERSVVIDYDQFEKYKKDLVPGYYIRLYRSWKHTSITSVKEKYGLSDNVDVMLYSSDWKGFEYYIAVPYAERSEAKQAMNDMGLNAKIARISSYTIRKIVSE